MKQGRDLTELAAELERQAKTKSDYIADTSALRVIPVEPQGNKSGVEVALVDLNDHLVWQGGVRQVAHGQIAEHTKIPKTYYDRMLGEAPELLANNVETWFRKYPAPRMVRTLDGGLRAFLSDKFRPLDNYDFANVILQAAAKRKLEVMSCEVTEKRLYIKAVDAQLFRDVPVGYKMGDGSHRLFDTCAPAFIASNSEVGFGRLVLDTGVYTRACTNLCLFADGGMKRTHLGSRHKVHELTGVENIDHLLRDETRQKSDEALWMQLRDVLSASFDPAMIGKRLERLQSAAENKIAGKVEKVVNRLGETFGLNEGETDNVLRHLIQGGSLTQYGLHAAVTRSAQDADDYDRATELEYLGGRIVELPRTEWESLALAA